MNLVEDFIDWATHDRRRSPHTIARYKAVLGVIFPAYGEPETIGTEAVEAWWATRYDMSPGTQANELACLRSFFKWATKFDHRTDDPTRRLDPPKVPNHVPHMIGRSDLERLMGELTADAPDLRRTFALGAYAGLRVSECAELEWKHIDIEQRRIFVRGKGQKERAVPLSAGLLDYLLPDTGGNVVTGLKTAYSGAVLQRKVNRLMERNGIDRRFHDLRKRGASVLLSKGANPAAVRQVFGWSSMETVTHYAVVGDNELDRIAEMLL